MIRSSIAGNIKESTKAINNFRISRIHNCSNIILDENNDDNNNINNITNNNKDNIDKEENINDNNLLSIETNIKQKLDNYPDDEEQKKFELKKVLDIIKEEENEDDNDFNVDNKKLGGSVHLYKIDIKEYQFNFNNSINNNLVKSNMENINAKNDIKNKLIGKINISSNSHNEEKVSDKNIKNNKF